VALGGHRYVDWAQQSIVALDSRQQLIALIERCTKVFTGEALARYREDPRLLRLWLAYVRLLFASPTHNCWLVLTL
jgi:hypothetical protein